MMRFFFFLPVVLIALSGCFGPKYIPAHYFTEKHTMSVTVHSLPSPTHSEVDRHIGETDPAEKIKKGLQSAQYSINQARVFSQIDNAAIQKDIEEGIKKRVEKIFPVDQQGRDLAVEVHIYSWGWIVPPESFLLSGSYQLFINGNVNVYDVQEMKKEIAHSSFSVRENLMDHLSISETKRAIDKAASDAAEAVTEFLWRSDSKEK